MLYILGLRNLILCCLPKGGIIKPIKHIWSKGGIYIIFSNLKMRGNDIIQKSFQWRRQIPKKSQPGHSLINWSTIYLPRQLGGLGILDIKQFARALRASSTAHQ